MASSADSSTLQAAYEGQLKRLAESNEAEAISEKGLVRDAYEVLSDPVRRKLYDERMLEELRRAMSSDGTDERPRLASASTYFPEHPTEPRSSSALKWMAGIALLVVAGAVCSWVYLDHNRRVKGQTLESSRGATSDFLRRQEADRHSATSDWAKERADAQRRMNEERLREYNRQREGSAAERLRQIELTEQRKRDADERRAELERQREETEIQRRARQDLERDKRYLRELEQQRLRRF